ncbi:disease resistance protein RPV1-like [Hevea brasiliensis]|uniref:disease resistance protein RPV1-like n=1 Tax=Hevea brasiliensis TaxID=3981 RepID=UPI0025F51EEB|nr:disease resistance protein RPV1-like [Hevea brasiliensis]
MASTSSTPPNQCKKWDVFISFRGDNTRYGIISHLSKSLKDKQIKTFTDEGLHKGEEISPELLKIIRESSVSIVILSENYANSPLCLDELVEILKCKEESGQIVLPVFYKKKTVHKRPTTGSALDGSKQLIRMGFTEYEVNYSLLYESKLVEEIINDVLEKFSYMPKNDDSYDCNLIGIESRVEKVEWLINDKQVMGIWGMGGTGKTTIAQEGSRIIVTSRYRQVLEYVCSKDGIYEVENLIHSQGLELFSLHAFKQNLPKEGYMELSEKATTYAGFNPLALKVLGSHLFNMGIEEWKRELKKLKGESLEKIQDVLKTSNDELGKIEKKIFLNVACFFKGQNKDEVERTLEVFGFYPKSGIPRLINKSLITVSSLNEIHMHDLLEQMGKDIVIKECKQPGGRSRLWNYEDISHVLTTEMFEAKCHGLYEDVQS